MLRPQEADHPYAQLAWDRGFGMRLRVDGRTDYRGHEEEVLLPMRLMDVGISSRMNKECCCRAKVS